MAQYNEREQKLHEEICARQLALELRVPVPEDFPDRDAEGDAVYAESQAIDALQLKLTKLVRYRLYPAVYPEYADE